jgi:hypothetical protein
LLDPDQATRGSARRAPRAAPATPIESARAGDYMGNRPAIVARFFP